MVQRLSLWSPVLNTVGAVSIDRIHDILHGACKLPISTGTIYNMVKRAVLSVAPSVEVIKEKVKALSLAPFRRNRCSSR